MGYEVADCPPECAEGGCDPLNGCVTCPQGKWKPDCKQDCHCRYGGCNEDTCGEGCDDWWILPNCSVDIPAPNISHVTPYLSIQSTSIIIEYQQADIDESLAEFYDYVAQYKIKDSTWTEVGKQNHDPTKEWNKLTIQNLPENKQYTLHIQPYREIPDSRWNNERRRPGYPSQEIYLALLQYTQQAAEITECPHNPTTTLVDCTEETSTNAIPMVAGICAAVALLLNVVTAVAVFYCMKRRYDARANAPTSCAPSSNTPTQNVPTASTDESQHYEIPPDAPATSHHNPDAVKYETIRLE